ncbi:hypothetical protein CEQ90_11120 [Lewinellaceae bacterium SD302]|nr:hypothetical protein CEQ90_11120 [Lewinellaceae bacterium SD302]
MTYQIKVPDAVQLSEFELTMNIAALLFDRGILSSGQAAEMVGLSKRSFLEVVGKYGVSIFQYDEDEFQEELDAI